MKKTNVVKLEQPEERLPQLNVPLTPDTKRDVKIACAMAGMSLKEWGARVLEWAAKHQIEKGKPPFELLLTPFSNNALTVETDSDTIPALETDGVVAQLVEHHNGIVAAKLPDNVLPLTPELIHAASLSGPSTHKKPTDSTAGKTSATGPRVFKSANATAAA